MGDEGWSVLRLLLLSRYNTALASIRCVLAIAASAGVCKACSSRDAVSAGRLAHFQQQFAKDLDPASPTAPQTLGDMTNRLKVTHIQGLWGVLACPQTALSYAERDPGTLSHLSCSLFFEYFSVGMLSTPFCCKCPCPICRDGACCLKA